MVGYAKTDRINAAEIGSAHFSGAVGEKFERFIYERMLSDKARNVILKEAEDAFANCVDDVEAPIGIWQGEFWGKLIVSACRACRYTGNDDLKNIVRDSVHRIMAFAREDGYLGTYKDERLVFRAPLEVGREKMGWDCNWNWNIWCRKYTLWALLEAYELLGEPAILDLAEKSTLQLITMLEDMDAKICETGTFYGLPSGSIMKPVLILYRHTENRRFLDFALEIANEWEDSETACYKIVKKSLEGQPIHMWYDDLDEYEPQSKGNPYFGEDEPAVDIADTLKNNANCQKAYEMMSCFDGLLELYRVTGTKKYLTAAENFFGLLIKHEYNPLFSVGFNDIFIAAGNYQNAITEICDVIHFIRLATELYKLTGEVRYIDFAELAFYNPFLAGVSRDGTWGARGVRGVEGHLYAFEQAKFKHNHCCVNNIPRGFVNAAEVIAASDKNAVYINLYGEADVTVNPSELETVHVSIGKGYLESCSVDINIDSTLSDSKKLMLRIPQWSIETGVRVDGKVYMPDAGEYFELRLVSGKMHISIDFDSTPRLIEGNYDNDFFPITPYMKHRFVSGDENLSEDALIPENKATLSVGAILLAQSKDLGDEKCFERETVCGKECECGISFKKTDDTARLCNCDVTFAYPDGKEYTVPMCDFASASDTLEFKKHRYTVFI